MTGEFKFWDKYMNLEQEELKLFNFILQFDFGDGNREYSLQDIKDGGWQADDVMAGLKFIICGYNDGKNTYLAFLDIDPEGGVGYTFVKDDSETAVEFEDCEIVAANIYAIVCDTLMAVFE